MDDTVQRDSAPVTDQAPEGEGEGGRAGPAPEAQTGELCAVF